MHFQTKYSYRSFVVLVTVVFVGVYSGGVVYENEGEVPVDESEEARLGSYQTGSSVRER